MPTAIGVGQFKNRKEIIYVAGNPPRLENFGSLDGLKSRVAGTDNIYDLDLPGYFPRIHPLSPDEKAYITKK